MSNNPISPRNHQQLVDVLEIYYARQVRQDMLRQVRRLRHEADQVVALDPARKREIKSYYDAMLFTADELLRYLGDDSV
ncbi:MAG: hypothetical protein NXH85_17145 [Pseudomonadaceae bacterium]|nr:hypothetical protein [Pseudomonadaceae bacterium]